MKLFSLSSLRTMAALMAVASVAAGCNTTGCTDNQNSVPLAGFYSYATFESVSLDSVEIGGVGAPADSLLLRPNEYGAGYYQTYLPLRAGKERTQFFIRYVQKHLNRPELFDTLTFNYVSTPYFASEECGAMYTYRITSLTHTNHLIDSVGISDSLITNVERESIAIYFRVSSETPGGEGSGASNQ